MTNYRDVFDWFVLTLNTIKKNKNAYWLIKPHPVEVWYGGLNSVNISKNETKHVKIYDKK